MLLFDTLSYYSIESAVKPQRTIKQTANNINCKVNSSNLCYTLNEPSQIVISLLTINGKVIKTFDHGLKPVGQHTLSLKGVSKGIYMVKFQTNKFSSVNKLIFN